ncbi:MAG: hypothetical protein V1694_05330 [Candidatus Eisenbacteria bacterium]
MTKVVVVWTAIILLLAPWLWATTGQEPHPPTNLEIPFLERDAMGARWIAMGGAAIAAVDDGSAIVLNPAGLGKIRRIELLGSIQKQSASVDATWFGNKRSESLSSTSLRELALAFPFPTYRGSLVIAASVARRNVLDGYTIRVGNLEDDPVYRDVEERDGMLTAWSGAVSLQVSPQAYIGFEGHAFTGDYNETDRWGVWGVCRNVRFASRTNLGGYGASVGMQYEPSSLLGIGAVLRTPQRITLEGDLEQAEYDAEKHDCVDHFYSIDDTATLPYSLGFGVSCAPRNLLLTLDLIYTDWRELKYPGPTRDLDTLTYDYTGDYIYEPTTDIRLGAEYALGAYPIRFRAGYARVPLELNWFEVKKDRQSISLGAGAVVESALALDLAWQRTSFERESKADSYSETRTNNRLILTLAYRF